MDNIANQIQRLRPAGSNNKDQQRRSGQKAADTNDTASGNKGTYNYLGIFNSAAIPKWRFGAPSGASPIVQ